MPEQNHKEKKYLSRITASPCFHSSVSKIQAEYLCFAFNIE